MDQPFDIKITVIGSDAFDLIEILRLNEFNAQSNDAEKQVIEQMS